jgi:hypothetical protein
MICLENAHDILLVFAANTKQEEWIKCVVICNVPGQLGLQTSMTWPREQTSLFTKLALVNGIWLDPLLSPTCHFLWFTHHNPSPVPPKPISFSPIHLFKSHSLIPNPFLAMFKSPNLPYNNVIYSGWQCYHWDHLFLRGKIISLGPSFFKLNLNLP